MLSRRLLRVKVMQMVYAFNKNGDVSIPEMEKELFKSIAKSYELYHLFLLLITDIHAYAKNRIEKGRNKKIPSPADLNPNTRFIDNAVLQQLADGSHLQRYLEVTPLSWSDHPELIRGLFNRILESPLYEAYMDDDSSDYASQQKFVVKIVEKVIAQYEPLYEQLEEHNIFWNDECEFIMSMVIKTLKEFQEDKGTEQNYQPEFKDAEDRDFVTRLYRKALVKQHDFVDLIQKYAQNWDLERVAYMDIVLMQIALAEILEFPEIPVNVSLNEYIELAKHYSTPKSSQFINGILDKVVEHFQAEKVLVKTGRGLME